MNKEEIINKLNKLNLDNSRYIVILGSSMVIQDIKETTNDIDIAVTKDYFLELKNICDKSYISDFNDEVLIYQNIEIGNNYYYDDNCFVINNIRFMSVENIYKVKKQLNRKKDQKDLNLIELFISKKDNRFIEKELYGKGYKFICGTDEVGRGPLVGPVVAAAVILPKNFELKGLTDSKKLSEKKRNEYDKYIKDNCISYGIGIISSKKIDEVNIYEASRMAMIEAIEKLKIKPDFVITDAMKLYIDIPTTAYIKGDIKSITISAASVVAKVYRDNLMYELDKKYPYYNFKNNKGYPTKDHFNAIQDYGILDEHRKSYGPVCEYIKNH